MAETTATDAAPPPSSEAPVTLPDYSQMIMAAIEALSEADGSSNSAIAKHIESIYGELPASHAALLTHHLNQMTQGGQIVMVNDKYTKPDPSAPPKRGRGRPPKAKDGNVCFSPKVSSGRPRGRPRKKSRAAVTAPPAEGGVKRGRGRPPKVKPAVEDGVVAT